MSEEVNKEQIEEWFKRLQDSICTQLEHQDGKATFVEDRWTREEGGGGRSRVISDGNVIEKGGVNFSAVHGRTPQKILDALNLPQTDFFATGVSIVIHPFNPYVPIIHMNVRYFEMDNGTWWFGGGIDLTPHYVNMLDAQFFHSSLKSVCDKCGKDLYEEFKTWADDYFYIPHRKETRGVGGIFFDHLGTNRPEKSKIEWWRFVQDVGSSFADTYCTLIERNYQREYSETEKSWQYLRRGRYVEFNLVYDKGTKFGLDTNGRTESILMSLPPQAAWEYNHKPNDNSNEYKTLQYLRKGIDWLGQ